MNADDIFDEIGDNDVFVKKGTYVADDDRRGTKMSQYKKDKVIEESDSDGLADSNTSNDGFQMSKIDHDEAEDMFETKKNSLIDEEPS